ncbi:MULTISPECIES: ABC transporter permease [Croceitalea]|uniref:ABC transporter permease n=1 Tax=Croceitalea vernalis TaxID=3075599 RepID=A0ABU3BFV4_9FLAO|nr:MULTISPECIES: ABC transporter permease [unclassified Croceitalea]MDT0539235.1 ABC transporter permease [Croceitalea sp. P059]MDT0621029.1 ABC transporter permease [Croceitalea sp. P007]
MRQLFDGNTWQEIFQSISKNKLRTFLTMIGVFVGIYIYIGLSGASKGLDNGFERQFETIAKNSLFAWGQSTSMPYAGFKTGRQIQLKLGDVDVLYNRVPEIETIAPRNVKGIFGSSPGIITRGLKSGNYSVYGDFPAFAEIATKKIYEGGRFINDADIQQARKVCVIGERTQRELFDEDENPIGGYIKIDNINFQVVGVHKFTPGGGFESDSDIFIPFATFKKLYNTGDNVSWFTIAAYDDADVIKVEEDIKSVLKGIHSVDPKDERAFGSFNLGEIFNKIMGFSNGMTFLSLIVGIATILAGVIGIGNILLISVKERTKELGVRRALGATPAEVRNQIIIESLFLTLLAGIIGIIAGAFTLKIIDMFTQGADFPYANPTVPIPYVIGSLLLMVILGVLIGLIPAQRAVSIKPIDALREE